MAPGAWRFPRKGDDSTRVNGVIALIIDETEISVDVSAESRAEIGEGSRVIERELGIGVIIPTKEISGHRENSIGLRPMGGQAIHYPSYSLIDLARRKGRVSHYSRTRLDTGTF